MFVDTQGFGYEATASWSGTMWWLCAVDTVLPIGDIVYFGGCVATVIVDTVNAIGADNIVRFATDGADAVNRVVNDLTSGGSNPHPPKDPFRSRTAANFRYNLQKLTGSNGVGKQAHHVLPQKFFDIFEAAGINIHEPKYGS